MKIIIIIIIMSVEIVPEEFSIFSQRPHIISVADSDVFEYLPINSVENAQTIEFNCLGFGEKYKVENFSFVA